jgi:hypothetical protein
VRFSNVTCTSSCTTRKLQSALQVPLPIPASSTATFGPRRSAYRYMCSAPAHGPVPQRLHVTLPPPPQGKGSSSAHHGHNQDHQDHVRDDLSTSTSLRHRHMVRYLAALHKHCALRAPDLYIRSPVRLGQTYETVRPLIRAEAMFQAPQTLAAA